MKQQTVASLVFDGKKKLTRRERFFAEMEAVVSWTELLGVIEPYYPKAGGRGRQPTPLATMLRIYLCSVLKATSTKPGRLES
jgi:hypothetical protein